MVVVLVSSQSPDDPRRELRLRIANALVVVR
jgi:hypothetical protein